MKNLFQAVVRIQKRLNNAQIPSAVIGGLAVAIWGEPRLTRDVDIKVLLGRDQAQRLLEVLTPDYTFLSPEPEQMLRRTGILFVQDQAGFRLDLLLADTPFDVLVIRRAKAVEVQPGLSIVICTPEDLILYKMISLRPRDREDVKGIVRRQREKLDDDYIVHWLQQFEQALDDSTLVAEYKRIRYWRRG